MRLKVRVWMLMIVVAVVGIVLTIAVRAVAYQQRADELDGESSKVIELVRKVDGFGRCSTWTLNGKDREEFIREAKALDLKRDEYRYAAWRPWLSIPSPTDAAVLVK